MRKRHEQEEKWDSPGTMHQPLELHRHGGVKPFGVLGPSLSFPVQRRAQSSSLVLSKWGIFSLPKIPVSPLGRRPVKRDVTKQLVSIS